MTILDNHAEDSAGLGVITPAEKSAFRVKEYEEAANAYFKGIEIGLNYMRQFFFAVAFLITGFFTCWSLASGQNPEEFAYYLMIAISIAGSFLSILLLSLLPYFDRQLANCSKRAVEIEKTLDGNLFSRIHNASAGKTDKRPFDSVRGVSFVLVIVLTLWILLGVAAWIRFA